MKNLRNNLILGAALVVASLFISEAKAQSFSAPIALSYTGIGTTAGGATTTVTNQVMDCTKVKRIGMLATFNFASTTTSNVVFTFARSLDNVNFETSPLLTWTVAGNGTTVIKAYQDVNVDGAGFLKLVSIQNTHASIVLTNTSFVYSIKKNAP